MIAPFGATSRRRDVLDGLWRIASSGRATLALLLLLAITLGLALTFPQLPAGLDTAARERWLSSAAAGYRGVGTLLRDFGVFAILEGVWLRGLLALLAYSLALRLADQLQRLGAFWRPLLAPPPYPPGLPTRQVAFGVSALESVREAMGRRYAPLVSASDAAGVCIYGRRGRLGAIGGLLVSVGPLLLLAGLIVNSVAGWRTTEMVIATRSGVNLPSAGGVQILVDEIAGADRDTEVHVTVVRPDGRESLRIRYARPGRSGDFWIAQLATGPALEAQAHSGARPLLLQALTTGGPVSEEIHTPFRQTQTEQAFAIPTRDIAFRVVSYDALPEQGIHTPVFLVEVYRGADSTPVLTQLVEETATLSIDDVVISLRRDRYAVLVAAYLPGMSILVAGALLLLIGALFVAGWGSREAWAYVITRGDGDAVTLHVRVPWRGRAEVDRLAGVVERLLETLAVSSAPPAPTPSEEAV